MAQKRIRPHQSSTAYNKREKAEGSGNSCQGMDSWGRVEISTIPIALENAKLYFQVLSLRDGNFQGENRDSPLE